MSLRDAQSNKRSIPVFSGQDLSLFAEWYDRLTSLLRSKGRRVRQCLFGKGPFKGMVFTGGDADDLDDIDDLRAELMTAPPRPLQDEAADGYVPPKIVDLDEKTAEDSSAKVITMTAAEVDVEIQIKCNDVSLYIYDLVLRHIGPSPHEELRNQDVREGDGPGAHRMLALIYQGQGSIGLIGVVKRLMRLEMSGEYASLMQRASEFRKLTETMRHLHHPLSRTLTNCLCLVGLSNRYDAIVTKIGVEGLESYSTAKVLTLVRQHKQLVGIKDSVRQGDAKQPAFVAPPTPKPSPKPKAPRPPPPPTTMEEKIMQCFNCRKQHKGGEYTCTAPCRLCGATDHVRYDCPRRKKRTPGQVALASVPALHVSRHSTSLLMSQPFSVDEDGPFPPKALPYLDSGAGGVLAAVVRHRGPRDRDRLEFPSHLVGGELIAPTPDSGRVTVGNGQTLLHRYSGSLWGFDGVKLVEGSSAHLVGVSPIVDTGKCVIFGPDGAYAVDVCATSMATRKQWTRIGIRDGSMYRHLVPGTSVGAFLADIRPDNPLELLHQRTHANIDKLIAAIRAGSILCPEITALSTEELQQYRSTYRPCHWCAEGKSTRRPVHRRWRMPRAIRPLQITLVDFSSQHGTQGTGGEHVSMYGFDQYCRKGWVVPTASRDRAPDCLRTMLKHAVGMYRQFGRTVLIENVRGDDAKEFESKAFLEAVREVGGVSNRTGAPHHRNSIADIDRYMRTIQDLSRVQMRQGRAPPSEWPYSDRYANYVYERLPHSGLRGLTPHELFYGTGRVPDVSKLRTWYAPVYVVRVGEHGVDKHEHVALFGRFLGYSEDKLGCVCRVRETRRILIRKDVHFIEDLEAGAHLEAVAAAQAHVAPSGGGPAVEVAPEMDANHDEKIPERKREPRSRQPVVRFDVGGKTQEEMLEFWRPVSKEQETEANIRALMAASNSHDILIPDDRVTYAMKVKEKLKYKGWSIPKSYRESLSVPDSKEWKEARQAEFDNFTRMKVWEECIRPDKRKVRILPIAEVYDVKLDKDGKPKKRKYRMCAKGFRQKLGIDYFGTCAPVVDPEVLRMCLAVAAELGLAMEQFDFTAAFLTSDTDVELYVELPPGYRSKKSGDVVLRLMKATHGMNRSKPPSCSMTTSLRM